MLDLHIKAKGTDLFFCYSNTIITGAFTSIINKEKDYLSIRLHSTLSKNGLVLPKATYNK